MENFKNNTEKYKIYSEFILYFEENYEKYFINGIINQAYCSNSILENYNNRLKRLSKNNYSWYEFVEALKKEESVVFKERTF